MPSPDQGDEPERGRREPVVVERGAARDGLVGRPALLRRIADERVE
jgi:hypothetical protein